MCADAKLFLVDPLLTTLKEYVGRYCVHIVVDSNASGTTFSNGNAIFANIAFEEC